MQFCRCIRSFTSWIVSHVLTQRTGNSQGRRSGDMPREFLQVLGRGSIVVISYSTDLAAEFHRQFRLVINADWFKQLYHGLETARDTGLEFITTDGGGRLAISVDGTFTGRGADLVVIDDPQKEDDAFSDVSRKRVIDWVTSTLFSRLNDKAKTPIILVQQRIHEDDLTGHLLRQVGWRQLRLQAIATARETIPLGNGRFHVREEGEPLHPARESLEILDRIKRDKGSLSFSLHYQQEPVPIEGNIIKRDWIRFIDIIPERKGGVLSGVGAPGTEWDD